MPIESPSERCSLPTRDLAYIALFAATIAALGVAPPIMIPALGVPITAQTLGVMLAGSILGAKRGGLALVLFLVLVAAGLPLLAGGRGGLAVFLGPGGGFLLAWPIAAFLIGLLCERFWARLTIGLVLLFNVLGGIGVIYAIGIPFVSAAASLTLTKAAIASASFIPGDLIKAVVAAVVAMAVRRTYPIMASR